MLNKKMKSFITILLFVGGVYLFGGAVLEDFKKLKPLDSKSFTLLGMEEIEGQYMVTAEMHFRDKKKIIDLFVSKDMKFVMFGNAFNAQTGIRYKSKLLAETIKKKKSIQKSKYDPTKLKELSVYCKGNGNNVYYLFTDFDCPFCKGVEKNFHNLKENVTLCLLPFPLRIHKGSKEKALMFMEMSNKKKKKFVDEERLSDINASGVVFKEETLARLESIKEEGKKAGLTGTPYLLNTKGIPSDLREIFKDEKK